MTWRGVWWIGFLLLFLIFQHFILGGSEERCVRLIHSSPVACSGLGGVLDAEADGSTICVSPATVPP